MTYEQMIFYGYLIYMLIMSVISIALFAKDKSLAKAGDIRIKEKYLLETVVFGGAIGGLFGRVLAKHKTNKIYFSLVIYLAIIMQILCAVILAANAFM